MPRRGGADRLGGRALAAALTALLAPAALGAYTTVQSTQIQVLADPNDFWATILTAAPGSQNILYGPDALTATGTSRLVFDLNGNPVDLELPAPVGVPVTASGSGLGAAITMSKTMGSLEYGATYTIVVNPHTGTQADTVQIQGWVANHSLGGPFPAPASVGLRIELDTMVGGVDGSPLSVDDGATLIGANTLFQASTEGVPSDWWSFNAFPGPSLTARGVAWGNQYGTAATEPDAEEFCQWPDVYSPTSPVWQTDPNPGASFTGPLYASSDTAMVLWYTNTGAAGYVDGDGVAQGDQYTVEPGETLVFTTYVGLNQGPLQASPTPKPTATISPTPSVSPTPSPSFSASPSFSVSPTTSPSFTVSQTYSASPTFSESPTISPTWTVSPTFSTTPSESVSPTRSPSFSASPTPSASPSATQTLSVSPSWTPTPSFSVSPTFTVSPTVTDTATLTPSFSVSPTFSESPSFSATPSVTATPSVSESATLSPTLSASPTPPASLLLTPKPPNPDPAGPDGVWLPYVLTCDAQVDIRVFDVAGEIVRDLGTYAAKQGANEEHWDGRNSAGAPVASGVYLARIKAVNGAQSQTAWDKMALVR